MIREHQYLFANLFGLVPLGLALYLARRQRKTAILCGVTLSLYSLPVAALYDRVYWTPDHIFGGGWGIEDAMFCFHVGVISWLFAALPWGSRLQMHPVVMTALRRFLTISLFAAVGLAGLLVSGLSVLLAFLLVQSISTAVIVLLRPGYTRLMVSGAPLFMLYYFLLLGLWRIVMPGFMDMWNGTELTGLHLFGVPVEEYLWVLSFCTGFPVTMAFVLDARLSHLASRSSAGVA